MFDIGWSEMAVIFLIALIVIGPKDLPRVARTLGQWVRKGRALAREFQTALEDMAREAELDKVKSEIEKAGRTDIGKTIEKSIDPGGEIGEAFDVKGKANGKAAKTAAAKTEDSAAKSKLTGGPSSTSAGAAKSGATKPGAGKPEPAKTAAAAAAEPPAVVQPPAGPNGAENGAAERS